MAVIASISLVKQDLDVDMQHLMVDVRKTLCESISLKQKEVLVRANVCEIGKTALDATPSVQITMPTGSIDHAMMQKIASELAEILAMHIGCSAASVVILFTDAQRLDVSLVVTPSLKAKKVSKRKKNVAEETK